MTKTLVVEGMKCKHCAAAVTKALEAVEGVASAAVDLEAKTAVAELTADVADEALKAAVEAKKFTVVSVQ